MLNNLLKKLHNAQQVHKLKTQIHVFYVIVNSRFMKLCKFNKIIWDLTLLHLYLCSFVKNNYNKISQKNILQLWISFLDWYFKQLIDILSKLYIYIHKIYKEFQVIFGSSEILSLNANDSVNSIWRSIELL